MDEDIISHAAMNSLNFSLNVGSACTVMILDSSDSTIIQVSMNLFLDVIVKCCPQVYLLKYLDDL